jgi:hypothetical protein
VAAPWDKKTSSIISAECLWSKICLRARSGWPESHVARANTEKLGRIGASLGAYRVCSFSIARSNSANAATICIIMTVGWAPCPFYLMEWTQSHLETASKNGPGW